VRVTVRPHAIGNPWAATDMHEVVAVRDRDLWAAAVGGDAALAVAPRAVLAHR